MNPTDKVDWSFARRPFWLFSHLFALTVVVSFVLLGFWQLNRHQERSELNARIEARTAPPALALDAALDRTADDVEYQLVEGTGSYVDDDVVRVANRTQGGVAGQHLVATFRLDDGRLVLVNRGFVPLDTAAPVLDGAEGPVTVRGWLRASVTQARFGAADDGEGEVVPRLDVDAIADRLDEPVAPVWLQLAPTEAGTDQLATFPDPLEPPDTSPGPHLSYMAQWWIFAILGVLFYGALLRRQSRPRPDDERPIDDAPQPPRSPTVSA